MSTPATPAAPTVSETEQARQAALAAEAAAKVAAPAAPAAPEPKITTTEHYTLTQNPDGNVHVKLVTGEEFSGGIDAVLSEIAKAKVATNLSYKELKSQIPAPPATPPPPPSEEEQVAGAVLEYLAKAVGKDPDELKESISTMEREVELLQFDRVSRQFLADNPDFPNDKAAADKLTQVLGELGLDMSPRNLRAAHALCVKEGFYKPLTAEQQAAVAAQAGGQNPAAPARPVPPPILPPGAPQGGGSPDPWAMDIDELRKQAAAESRRQ